MKILVVDDLEFVRTLIRDILETGGHAIVAEAADGRQALLLRRAGLLSAVREAVE